MTELYVVTMQRWGDDETHNYTVGIFDTLKLAEAVGQAHREWRGGKYEPLVERMVLNQYDQEMMDHCVNKDG